MDQIRQIPATTETIQSQKVIKIDDRTFQIEETVVKVSPLAVEDLQIEIKNHQNRIADIQSKLAEAAALGVDISETP